MYTTISKEATEAIARIIWDILDEWFGDTVIFDPIVVIPSRDLCDEPYIEVYSAYSHDPKVLDPHWQFALEDCVRPHLEELGISPLLHDVFFPRSKRRGRPWGPRPLPPNATIAHAKDLEIYRRRHHDHGDEKFLLKAVSESVVRVTHRDQTGYFGLDREWKDPTRSYTTTRQKDDVCDDGIDGVAVGYRTPADALNTLCGEMLADQLREDVRQASAGQWQGSANRVLRGFLEELPSRPECRRD